MGNGHKPLNTSEIIYKQNKLLEILQGAKDFLYQLQISFKYIFSAETFLMNLKT